MLRHRSGNLDNSGDRHSPARANALPSAERRDPSEPRLDEQLPLLCRRVPASRRCGGTLPACAETQSPLLSRTEGAGHPA